MRTLPNPKHERRDWAAEKAAPYMHPKLNAIEANVNSNVSLAEALDAMKARCGGA
jgi:hypothetical protein